jgi:hypothetical protein
MVISGSTTARLPSSRAGRLQALAGEHHHQPHQPERVAGQRAEQLRGQEQPIRRPVRLVVLQHDPDRVAAGCEQ